MKKFLPVLFALIPVCLLSSACKKQVDYFSYVSEYRKSVYLLKEDNYELKIYCTERETPYLLNGVKGDTTTVTEVYYFCEKTPQSVEIEISGQGGEMSYIATTRNFYLSFTGEFEGSEINVNLNVDGKEVSLCAHSVAEEGVIGGKSALKCVREYDKNTFDELSEGGNFNGEIQIRLLYDDGCFYYVGVCDRSGNVHAYLVDGTSGRILAEKQGNS